MPKLLLAVIICISAVLLCFYVLNLANVPRDFSIGLATSNFAFVQYIHQALQKESGSVGFAALPRGIVPLAQYDLRWQEVLVYPTFVFLGVWGALTFVVGVILGAALAEAELDIELTSVSGTLLFVSAVVAIITIYHIGVWIGSRYTRHPFLMLFLICIIARLTMSGVDSYQLNPEEYKEVYGDQGATIVVLQMVIGTLMFVVAGAVGVLRGRKRRLSKYMSYLLRRLPPETKTLLVELAYEESLRIQKT